jgi:4-hydroxybenzoate polyprenyltransferase
MKRNVFVTLVRSMRITWASKNVNMFLLALTYAYFGNISINNPLEIIAGLILVSVLWGALYTLNDFTDQDLDRRDRYKKNRAFIQNTVEKKYVILFIILLISLVFIISLIFMDPAFTLILALMFLNQVLYTVPPLRFKETSFSPLFSTATNSVLRLASCAVLLGNIFIVPPSVYIFVFLAGMGTYLMYKTRTRDASVVGVVGGLTLLYIFYSGEMNVIQFLVALAPSLIAGIPLYLSLFGKKEEMLNLANILYHQVALVFFLLCILIIIF